jgi:hypothetical protein
MELWRWVLYVFEWMTVCTKAVSLERIGGEIAAERFKKYSEMSGPA